MSSSEKRYHILIIAEKLFAQKGYNGTSVRDIAEAANVNISMISYYFGSKEGLMQALFMERTSDILPKLEELARNKNLTPFEKVDILVDDYVHRALQKLLFHKILISEQMLEKNPIITDLINQLKTKNMEILKLLIAEGQEKGVFKNEVDIVLMMNSMSGTVTQSFINQDYYKKYHHLDDVPKEEFELLLKEKLSRYIKDLFKSILSYEA